MSMPARPASGRLVVAPDVVIGRKDEIGVLTGLVDAVVAGRGGVAWVEGEPGIGKSTLITAGLAGAAERGCDVFWSVADELTRRLPLRAILDCLQISRAGVADAVRGDVVPKGDGGDGGLPQTGDPVAGAAERVLELVERGCAAQPVVLVIDDLHQADEPSLRVWEQLAALTHQLPLLLVAALRPAARRAELRQLRHDLTRQAASIITLGPLSADEVADLATHLIGAPPGTRLRELLGRAGGNPLYVTEIAQAIQRDNLFQLQPAPEQPAAAKETAARPPERPAAQAVAEIPATVGPDRLPASLATAITDRLAALHADSVPVLRMAALLGADCTQADLATVLDEPLEWLAPVMADAVAAGVLLASGEQVTFRHPLFREAVTARLPHAVRAALLRQAAQALAQSGAPASRVSAYLLEATEIVDTWVIDWLTTTAPDLVQQSPTVAEELLNRILPTLPDDDPRRERLEIALLHVHFLEGRNDHSQRMATWLLDRVDDPDGAAEIAWILGHTLMRLGQYEAGLVLATEMAARPGMAPQWQARLHGLTALILREQSRVDDADRQARAALDLAERANDRIAKAYALHVLAAVTGDRGDFTTTLSLVEDALEVVGTDPQLTDLRPLLLANRLVTLVSLDRLREVDPGLQELLRLAERGGAARLTMIRMVAAQCYFYVGRWDDAIAELDAMGVPTRVDILVRHHGFAAMIAARRNDRDTAARHLAEVTVDLAAPKSPRNLYTWILVAQAIVAEQSGNPQQGVAALSPTLRTDFGKDFDNVDLALPLLVRLALASGDEATATAGASAAEAFDARERTAVSTAAAAQCRGLLTDDPDLLLDAATRLRECGWQVRLADTLADAAVLLASRGELDRARATHAEAYQLLDSLGAEWDIRRLDTRLRAFGIRRGERGPRRRPRTGWNALTPTEHRVAQFVATGLSNPDIAENLVMSRRTVQTHVSNILAKLNARSRAEIAHHAATHEIRTA